MAVLDHAVANLRPESAPRGRFATSPGKLIQQTLESAECNLEQMRAENEQKSRITWPAWIRLRFLPLLHQFDNIWPPLSPPNNSRDNQVVAVRILLGQKSGWREKRRRGSGGGSLGGGSRGWESGRCGERGMGDA
jgi:hypothetical protein